MTFIELSFLLKEAEFLTANKHNLLLFGLQSNTFRLIHVYSLHIATAILISHQLRKKELSGCVPTAALSQTKTTTASAVQQHCSISTTASLQHDSIEAFCY